MNPKEREELRNCKDCMNLPGLCFQHDPVGNAMLTNQDEQSDKDELEKILDRIVSQEANTEGGYAEYALKDEDIKYGNPLHNKSELKAELLTYCKQQVEKAVREAQSSVMDDFSKGITEARLNEVQRFDLSSYGTRDEHEQYIQKRLAELQRNDNGKS